MSTPSNSIYKNLSLRGRQIRLLEIITTPPQVECKLEVANLDDRLVFSALPYVWGDSNITKEITVNGERVPVTVNLAGALEFVPQHLQNAKATPRL